MIGVIIFFTVISIISAVKGGDSISAASVSGMIFLPFVIGIVFGVAAGAALRKIGNNKITFVLFLSGLVFCIVSGLLIDGYIFNSFSLNYLLIGMSYSAAVANIADEEKLSGVMRYYSPVINISLIIVIVDLGIPLDYHLIAGAGIFTAVYIVSRAIGKIGSAFIGGKITKAEPTVTKYLGLTLLPHSGVSLVFTGIAVNAFSAIDTTLASIISGTIVAAAIINEIIAVILAKIAFKKAGELNAENKSQIKKLE